MLTLVNALWTNTNKQWIVFLELTNCKVLPLKDSENTTAETGIVVK